MALVFGTMVQWFGAAHCRHYSVGVGPSGAVVAGSAAVPWLGAVVLLRGHMVVGDLVATKCGGVMTRDSVLLLIGGEALTKLLGILLLLVVHFGSGHASGALMRRRGDGLEQRPRRGLLEGLLLSQTGR